MAVTNGAGSSHQVLDFMAKSKSGGVIWCILFQMDVPVLVNIQRQRRQILKLHLNE